MKIGLSTSVIQRGQTGIAQYVFALVREFSTRAAEHQFVLFVLEDDLPLFAPAAGNIQLVTVPERFRPPVKNVLWHQTELPKLARQLGLDVLHVPSYRRMLWPRPCPLVATIHDLAPFEVNGKYDAPRMFYGRVIAKHLARRQDHIITVSHKTARDIERYFGINQGRVTVIHNGVDRDQFFPAPAADAKRLVSERLSLAQPFFLYVARLEHPAKNHVRLVEAFTQFKAQTGSNWQLVFGGSDWHGAAAIHRAIRGSPFAKDIRCLGFVAQADLPNLYRAADVFIYPSLFEGFGMPPLEAMACGCPVISSRRGSLAEVLGNSARIVDPENVLSLKCEMARLAVDPALREQLRRSGLAHAKLFDWRNTAAATLCVFSKMAAQHREVSVKRTVSREEVRA
jgi:glycosyltransferase involved in cell wall biosynthesis